MTDPLSRRQHSYAERAIKALETIAEACERTTDMRFPPRAASDTGELPLSVEYTTEVVRIETADNREVAMWTRDELAESPEAFGAAFGAVQQARDAPAELLERHREHLNGQIS